MAADTHPQRSSKGPRPFEDELPGAGLIPRAEWHRCADCEATFATREGLRGHRRFHRCPALDPSSGVAIVGARDSLKDAVLEFHDDGKADA